MKKALFHIVLIIFLFSMPSCLYADFSDDLSLSGYFEKRECWQLKSPHDIQASENLFRGELRKFSDNTLLFVSADFKDNKFSDDETSLHEAYIDYSLNSMSFKIGKQIIIKGNSDSLRVTDIISPVDSSEFVTRSFDETRMAVDALNFSYNRINYSLNLIYIPVFTAAETPEYDSPWNKDETIDTAKEIEPDKTFSNSEKCLELKFFLPGLDFSFFYFNGFSDYPVYYNSNELVKQYKKENIFGGTFTKPVNDFVIRGEAVIHKGTYLTNKVISHKPVETDILKYIAGLDYYPGSNLTLSAQYYEEDILSHHDLTNNEKSKKILTFSASKKLFREKLNLSSMLYFNLEKEDSYLRLSTDYELTANLKIFAGSDLFAGSSDTNYGRYEDNSQLWAKI
eukprot:gnl/Chilomastix_cuspidata/8195.p1 GENE.gnl/Chilomastix_cuspidata/8195~~gnl/Chilomastix_cuspidata/8195.p1  ORF type:complete len:396 (-),score=30.38 gnl/Chilomastix_cuspidata/8195:31-1218(-)